MSPVQWKRGWKTYKLQHRTEFWTFVGKSNFNTKRQAITSRNYFYFVFGRSAFLIEKVGRWSDRTQRVTFLQEVIILCHCVCNTIKWQNSSAVHFISVSIGKAGFVSAYHILNALFSARNEISRDGLPNKRVQLPDCRSDSLFIYVFFFKHFEYSISNEVTEGLIDEELLGFHWYLNPCCYTIVNRVFYNYEVDLTTWFRAPFFY